LVTWQRAAPSGRLQAEARTYGIGVARRHLSLPHRHKLNPAPGPGNLVPPLKA